ncbi:hypothetical protein BIV25_37615 [Streptomyces sp. MUSC 14]|uniref:HNH endonuclease family protein n=1 Tax=Streptomyces sp. MUSC 14 TaxID=1354889 RepID=UPI0008F5A2F1|nr:HNH endonuclease family protein [Streptomyces sp. MUSC 14]OIJ87866.1 hypothetical protein BIV25_37615 [Streptomyces sp. MUSC 14]
MRRAFFGLSAAGLLVTVVSAGPALADPPAPPPVSTARSELAALTVATPHSMNGYARDKFDIWAKQPDGCTTRQEVLARDGKNVQDKPGSCQPASGSWYSVYDNTTVTDVTKATIDHMVPLAMAWISGADTWTADQRKAFGNDLKDPQLLIASESSNSSKGDSGPDGWKPTNRTFWCTYAEDYTHVKSVWKLTTTAAEKSALSSMLDTCTS